MSGALGKLRRALYSPAQDRQGNGMKSYIVGRVGELADGDRKVISCDGTEIGVFMVDGELVAWYNQCAHRGGPVCQGRIYRQVIDLAKVEKIRLAAQVEGARRGLGPDVFVIGAVVPFLIVEDDGIGRVEPVDADGETRMLQHDPKRKNIVCPWHGWEFDLRTGRHPAGEKFALRKAKLEVADGHVYVVV